MNVPTSAQIGHRVRLHTDFETALARVTEALKSQGFGVLTEIDVKETLKKKLDVDFRPYRILGACNPSLAYQALQAAPEVGLLLPCNVIVSQVEEGAVEVGIVDPLVMLGVMTNESLTPVAEEAGQRLNKVLAILQEL